MIILAYLEHLDHLVCVPQKKDATVLARDVLDFCDDGIDDGGLELV
jgi:hypothetical protein